VTPGPSDSTPQGGRFEPKAKEELMTQPEVGDELVVDSLHAGEPARKGEILEVRVDDGREHFMVRWDDTGHETLFFPGPTPHVLQTHPSRNLGRGT
jgi:hypothetical protein